VLLLDNHWDVWLVGERHRLRALDLYEHDVGVECWDSRGLRRCDVGSEEGEEGCEDSAERLRVLDMDRVIWEEVHQVGQSVWEGGGTAEKVEGAHWLLAGVSWGWHVVC